MVTKEPSEYYRLKGYYRLRNLITGKDAFVSAWSTPTPSKLCWEKLPILREKVIYNAKGFLSVYLRINRKECELQWVLVEILNEEWQKL